MEGLVPARVAMPERVLLAAGAAIPERVLEVAEAAEGLWLRWERLCMAVYCLPGVRVCRCPSQAKFGCV